MKKMIYMGALALIAAGGIFWSCQKDEFETNPENGLMLKSASQENCDCINLYGPYCEMTDVSALQKWGAASKQKSKQISYVAYNTDTKFIVKVTATGNFDADATYTVTVNFGGEDAILVKTHKGAGDVDAFEFDLPAGWQSVDKVSLTVYQEGSNNPVTLSATYSLVGICPPAEGCTESFSYETTDNMQVVFSYTSDVTLENAVVKFTCPQIDNYISNDGKEYSPNPGQMNGTDNVLTWTGNITACIPITFEITFNPHCTFNVNSNKWNNPNVWTDFKVNGESKKTITPPDETTAWPIIIYSDCK